MRVLTRECEVVSGEGAYESVREWVVRVLTRECEGVSGEGANECEGVGGEGAYKSVIY